MKRILFYFTYSLNRKMNFNIDTVGRRYSYNSYTHCIKVALKRSIVDMCFISDICIFHGVKLAHSVKICVLGHSCCFRLFSFSVGSYARFYSGEKTICSQLYSSHEFVNFRSASTLLIVMFDLNKRYLG